MIAEGTADELKDQIGGEVLELHVADKTQAGFAADALKGVGAGDANVDAEAGIVRVPGRDGDGPAALLDAVRRLDDARIRIGDIALHRPTLDDVFLTLTGPRRRGGADGRAGRSRPAGGRGAKEGDER